MSPQHGRSRSNFGKTRPIWVDVGSSLAGNASAMGALWRPVRNNCSRKAAINGLRATFRAVFGFHRSCRSRRKKHPAHTGEWGGINITEVILNSSLPPQKRRSCHTVGPLAVASAWSATAKTCLAPQGPHTHRGVASALSSNKRQSAFAP